MRAVRWVVLGVVVVMVAAEFIVPALAEARIEDRVRQQLRGAAAVQADVGTFPVVSRFLLTATVPRVAVTLSEVTGQEVPLTEVRYAFEDVGLGRSSAFRGEVEVTGVERGVVTAEIRAADLSAAFGGQVTVGPDVPVQVRDRRLDVAGVAGPVIPEDLMPCAPEVDVQEDRLVLSCTLERVPDVLVPGA